VLKIHYTILFPLILFFCLIGVYTVNNSVFDIYLMVIFGFVGYLMKKFRFEPAPLAMAYVLSPILESSFRQSLSLSAGSFAVFFSRPISLVCMGLVAALLIFQLVSSAMSRRRLKIARGTGEV
jgi:putative tricarboxylic transport membrane protein